ncbi:hypothetical protein KA082_01815 [Candidatus Woesebacteria bacterium]|nr:hypothetical protein [Candidatus Woesebacteria bacterium]
MQKYKLLISICSKSLIALCVVAFLFACTSSVIYAANYYISPTGNDSNIGTSKNAPWKTFCRALNTNTGVQHGDTLTVLDGIYRVDDTSGTCAGDPNYIHPKFAQAGASLSVPEADRYAKIIAENSGKAIILGDGLHTPVYLEKNYGVNADYVHIEGLTILNSGTDAFEGENGAIAPSGTKPIWYAMFAVIKIHSDNNIIRNVSAYHPPRGNAFASPNQYQYDYNGSILQVYQSDKNLIEDSVFGGVGRKIVYMYSASPLSPIVPGDSLPSPLPMSPRNSADLKFNPNMISEGNIFRRIIAIQTDWEGRNFCGVEWPGGEPIQIYGGGIGNIVENAIAIGNAPNTLISAHANGYEVYMEGIKILGSVAVYGGKTLSGQPLSWPDNGGLNITSRPGPTTCKGLANFVTNENKRSGVDLHGQGYFINNEYKDNLAYGNAGLGFGAWIETTDYGQKGATYASNNQISQMTLYGNGKRLSLSGYVSPVESVVLKYDANIDYRDFLSKDTRTGLPRIELSNSKIEFPTGNNSLSSTQTQGSGAQIYYQYQNGTLTSTPLWTSPNIQNIRARSYSEFSQFGITSTPFDMMALLKPILEGKGASGIEYDGKYSVIPDTLLADFESGCCGSISFTPLPTVIPTPTPVPTPTATPTPAPNMKTFPVPATIPISPASFMSDGGSFQTAQVSSTSQSGDSGKTKAVFIKEGTAFNYQLVPNVSGSYVITVRAASAPSDGVDRFPKLKIFVDNQEITTLSVPMTANWDTFVNTEQTAAVTLEKRATPYVLSIQSVNGWLDLLSVTVTATDSNPSPSITPTPVPDTQCSKLFMGDVNCDGRVDTVDLLILLGFFNTKK